MQKNVANKGPNKKQQEFDDAFAKLAGKLSNDYRNQFKKPDYATTQKQSKQVNNAMRTGKQLDFVKKGTGNKKPLGVNIAEALDDSNRVEIKLVPKETALAIMNARNAKSLNQEKLGMLVSVGPHVIRDIEAGTAQLNYDLINKIEKALDTKLPRPWKQDK